MLVDCRDLSMFGTVILPRIKFKRLLRVQRRLISFVNTLLSPPRDKHAQGCIWSSLLTWCNIGNRDAVYAFLIDCYSGSIKVSA